MNKIRQDWQDKVLATVDCFARNDYWNNTFQFLMESDIQCALFSKLRKEVNGTIPLKGNLGESGYIEQTNFKINAIHSEYHWDIKNKSPKGYSDKKFDIVCLDPENHDLSEKYFLWWQPILVGVEIKIWTPGYSISDKIQGSIDDSNYRLKKYMNQNGGDFKWLSLCFIMDNYDNYKNHHPRAKGINGLEHALSLLRKRKKLPVNFSVNNSVDAYDHVYIITKNEIYCDRSITGS